MSEVKLRAMLAWIHSEGNKPLQYNNTKNDWGDSKSASSCCNNIPVVISVQGFLPVGLHRARKGQSRRIEEMDKGFLEVNLGANIRSTFFFFHILVTKITWFFFKFAVNFRPKVHFNRSQGTQSHWIAIVTFSFKDQLTNRLDPLWCKILWSPNGQNVP